MTAPGTRTVRGSVLDSVTGQPIADAVVHAAGQTTGTHTAADGSFALPGVPADALAVVAARQGYRFRWSPLPIGSTAATFRLDPATADTVPHPDYPRPDADHRGAHGGHWLSLNGTWSLDFAPHGVGRPDPDTDPHVTADGCRWPHVVDVPFSYTSLAGVGEQARAGKEVFASQFAEVRGTVWYQRNFRVPADWPADHGCLLRFGAVDWSATVYLDGVRLGEHDGGYTPFDVDLGALAPGSEHSLVVRVDVADNSVHSPYPQGKQMGWYTDTGGIWQSVWLEPTSGTRLETVHVTPRIDLDGDSPTTAADVAVHATGTTDGLVRLEIREQAGTPGFAAPAAPDGITPPIPRAPEPGRIVATGEVRLVDGAGTARLDVPDGRLWCPETPWLYRIRASLGDPDRPLDVVDSWFGLRTVTRDWAPGHSPAEESDPDEQYQYIYLNGRPIYLRSVLDQAFNPWGGYSYTGQHQGPDLHSGELSRPGKGSVLFDVALAKQLGVNSVRLHIKVNDPLYYHWADVAGLLVWYDQPNFGYHGFSPRAKELWADTLRAAVARDVNHPSIVIWCAFNEAWGFGRMGAAIRPDAVDWVRDMTTLLRDLVGDTRLVVDNSPCCANEHVSEDTDLNDFHDYRSEFGAWQRTIEHAVARCAPGSTWNFQFGKQSGQPLVNSEFGPWSGGRDVDQEVATPFRSTTGLFRQQPKLAGHLFTELTDVEFEWNGWVTYDRTHKEPGYLTAQGKSAGVSVVEADDVLIVRGYPVRRVRPGAIVGLPVTASLFAGRDTTGCTMRWRITGTDSTGTPPPEPPWQSTDAAETVTPQRFTACDLGTVCALIPADLVAGRFDVQLVQGDAVLASGQTFLVAATSSSTVDTSSPVQDRTVITLDPIAAQGNWPMGERRFLAAGASAAAGVGDGAFRWTVPVPDGLADGSWRHVQLVLEAGAARPELPRTSHPQTSGRRYPTTLAATVNGVRADEVTLPDDPADARGALSHESGYAPGKYGYRVVLDLDADRLRPSLRAGTLSVELRGVGGGLTVFGPRTGRYGITPQLVFARDNPVPGNDMPPAPAEPDDNGVHTHLLPGRPVDGQPGTMTVTVVNDSPHPIHDVNPILLVPPGWSADPVDHPTAEPLPPRAARHAHYTVTPNAAVAPKLRTRAYFTNPTGPHVVETPWRLPDLTDPR